MALQKIENGFMIPSAAYGVKKSDIKFYDPELIKKPEPGDIVYGEIFRIGQHSSLENRSGRIHKTFNGSKNIFVYGNRYAPDVYEGIIPDSQKEKIDLIGRSGVISVMRAKHSHKKDPTKVKVLGYVCDGNGQVLNTKNYPAVVPKRTEKKPKRAKLVVFVGTSMNSGKSFAAASAVRALTRLGNRVHASKITGTATLNDILAMNDAGAQQYADFSFVGYPSTYMLNEKELVHIFNTLDLKYGNNEQNYWVVEIADGITQRETSMLLQNEELRSRIHRLVFCASDGIGAMGGLEILKKQFDLEADMVSGLCTSSPLHVRELKQMTKTPIFDSANPSLAGVRKHLL